MPPGGSTRRACSHYRAVDWMKTCVAGRDVTRRWGVRALGNCSATSLDTFFTVSLLGRPSGLFATNCLLWDSDHACIRCRPRPQCRSRRPSGKRENVPCRSHGVRQRGSLPARHNCRWHNAERLPPQREGATDVDLRLPLACRVARTQDQHLRHAGLSRLRQRGHRPDEGGRYGALRDGRTGGGAGGHRARVDVRRDDADAGHVRRESSRPFPGRLPAARRADPGAVRARGNRRPDSRGDRHAKHHRRPPHAAVSLSGGRAGAGDPAHRRRLPRRGRRASPHPGRRHRRERRVAHGAVLRAGRAGGGPDARRAAGGHDRATAFPHFRDERDGGDGCFPPDELHRQRVPVVRPPSPPGRRRGNRSLPTRRRKSPWPSCSGR